MESGDSGVYDPCAEPPDSLVQGLKGLDFCPRSHEAPALAQQLVISTARSFILDLILSSVSDICCLRSLGRSQCQSQWPPFVDITQK